MATAWTADFTFTVDSINYTADGAILFDSWRADTDHFTVDDDLYHTADGWHDDEAYSGGGRAIWGPLPVDLDRYRQRRLREEDDIVLKVIGEWLKKAA